jgi:hypothetical protein
MENGATRLGASAATAKEKALGAQGNRGLFEARGGLLARVIHILERFELDVVRFAVRMTLLLDIAVPCQLRRKSITCVVNDCATSQFDKWAAFNST